MTSTSDPSPSRATAASPDVARFTFTDHGPWVVDPDEVAWSEGLPALRLATRRQVPLLTGRRRVPPPGRTAVVGWHLGRALGAWALVDRRKGGAASRAGISRRLRRAAERLGPTYIKLGQIISSGEGL
ncbi:MAG: AarF/ABC1/UbiB kinase family protein, partial [Actinomycetes bacterium]